MKMRTLLAALLLLALPEVAVAQIGGGVQQNGPITPGNCTQWLRSGIIEDSGSTCGGGGGGGSITIGTTTITGGTSTRVLYDNAGIVGEYIITGTGNVVMSASPSLTGTVGLSGATTTGPDFQVSMTGDTNARVSVGLNAGDEPRLSMGPGNTVRDVFLIRDAANTFAQRNGVNAQTFRVYNSFTDPSNYERGIDTWSKTANVYTIGTENNGTGVARSMRFMTGGTERWQIGSTSGSLGTVGATASFVSVLGGSIYCYVSAIEPVVFAGENRGTSSSVAGATMYLLSNDSAAMASGDRLGGVVFAGSITSSTISPSANIQAFANQNWVNGSAYGSRIVIQTVTDGTTTPTTKLTVNNDGGLLQITTTVSALGSASTVGIRKFVTDALTPVFGSTVTGGGAVGVPVYSDGTNWIVG